MAEPKNLIEIIRANPGATLRFDNDCWYLIKKESADDPFLGEDDHPEWNEDEWHDRQEIATTNDSFTDPKHGGICYGEGMLYALAEMAGIKVEGV